MRRSGLKRKPSDELLERMHAFKYAALGPCAGCGQYTHPPADAHHVVYRQHLPIEHQWDERNALNLCRLCHERHHNASRRIPLAALTEANREFAREVLGDAADDYLSRRYAPSVPKGEERNDG